MAQLAHDWHTDVRHARSGRQVLRPIKAHADWIWSLAFSPDESTLASGSRDGTIGIWDPKTGNRALKALSGHTHSVHSVTFAPNSSFLISGSEDHTIRVWNVLNGQPIGGPVQTGATVLSVAISPDGEKIAGACNDMLIRVFQATTHAFLFQCAGHQDAVLSVAFSPDGLLLATGSHDHTIRLWDGATGRSVGDVLQGHTYSVRSVAFSPDGRHVASASFDSTIRLWDVTTGVQIGSPLSGFSSWAWAVAFTPDGFFHVSGSNDGSIKVWDIRKLIQSVKVRNQPEAKITSTTRLAEIASCLVSRGCEDMYNSIDWTTVPNHPHEKGGLGDIYRCRLTSGDEVAIKIIRLYESGDDKNKKALKHIAHELYVWSKCRHVNVQRLCGFSTFRGQLAIVTPWEHNGSLPRYLDRYPEADRWQISIDIAAGMVYLHTLQVIHGDLKGANVLISMQGVARVADFGNAGLHRYTLKFESTSNPSALSTRWTAPELFSTAKYSFAADVYALGMTILETITGKLPWYGKTELSVIRFVAVERAIPERPLDIIPENSYHGDSLWILLKRCWEFEPESRPSVRDVKSTLREITIYGLQAETLVPSVGYLYDIHSSLS
ncbi:Tyrosine kinase family catalytic domain protein [Ceratobasidium sp. AG-Ba]|nr:Tyrosine kinase family catalytic domain protein [Ceratobasidium sp. AG-Ba]